MQTPGPLLSTSTPTEIAAYLYAAVATPIMRETPRQEFRTGDDVADFLKENAAREAQVYDETLLATFDDPPVLRMVSVAELVDTVWPELAADVFGLLLEHISSGIQDEP